MANSLLWSSVDTQAILFGIFDVCARIVNPLILIYVYQRKIAEVGFGPNELPEHLFEHREHGWEGGLQLRVSDTHYIKTRV
jgi:hypothetical protein